MLDSKDVRQKTINGLSIGPMYFDPWWPWTGLLQGHDDCSSNIVKMCCVNVSRIRNYSCAIDWHDELCFWMTLNRSRSRSGIFAANISNMVTERPKLKVGLKGGQIANHQWAVDWHYEVWHWITLNCLCLENGFAIFDTACIWQIHVPQNVFLVSKDSVKVEPWYYIENLQAFPHFTRTWLCYVRVFAVADPPVCRCVRWQSSDIRAKFTEIVLMEPLRWERWTQEGYQNRVIFDLSKAISHKRYKIDV